MNIVNELDDLCDFTKVSQRWKQARAPSEVKNTNTDTDISCEISKSNVQSEISKTNPWNKENCSSNEEYKKLTITKVRSHVPQVIDEDTEQFKLKLEHLLNVFKTEATSEFMQMKRSMLDDQKQTITHETERYIQMYEQKNQELIQTQEQLQDQKHYSEILNARCDSLAGLVGKLKNKSKNYKTANTIFKALKQNKEYQRQKKRNNLKATFQYKKSLKRCVVKHWSQFYHQSIRETLTKQMKLQQQKDMDQLVAKFSKEQQSLEQKLQEATSQLDESNKLKQGMQENLKRAFMRGVCALNFEAMSVLQGGNQNLDFDQNLLVNPVNNDTISLNQTIDFKQSPQPQQQVIFHNQNQIDTNDHKWKDAPLVGFRNMSEITEHNSVVMSASKLVQQDDNEFETEGKVIKVNFEQQKQRNQQPQPKVEKSTSVSQNKSVIKTAQPQKKK